MFEDVHEFTLLLFFLFVVFLSHDFGGGSHFGGPILRSIDRGLALYSCCLASFIFFLFKCFFLLECFLLALFVLHLLCLLDLVESTFVAWLLFENFLE